jgi:RNA polymerase sigma factor (sigma-70 family)
MKLKNEQTTKSSLSSVARRIGSLRISNTEKETLKTLIDEPIAFIPNDQFRRPKAMSAIMEQHVDVIPGQSLKADEEKSLFLQLNYTRYKACQIRRQLLSQSPWTKKTVLELLDWNKRQLHARSQIVTANMGLVLAMAKKVDFPGVEFTDLISEGSMALLRAADKFDFDRGFKFSTYACRAIFKGFSRTAKQNYRYRRRFPAQWDIALEKDDHLDLLRAEDHSNGIDEVRTIFQDNIADLSRVEQSVIEMRFSLKPKQDKPLTLKQVGDKLGLTKERIRQIQNKALAKMRIVAEERIVFQ